MTLRPLLAPRKTPMRSAPTVFARLELGIV
jgi:hypothetical protein